MSGHIDGTRLNDYLEGVATAEDAKRIEGHLGVCDECRASLAALERLLARMAELPSEAMPSRDLWPDIRSRLGAGVDGAEHDVVPLRPRGSRGRSGGRRFSLSMWQLLAASVALACLSGGTVWMVLRGDASRDGVTVASETRPPADVGPAVRTATTEYEDAIAGLESVLERGKAMLAPETLTTIEESLRIVDEAIDEARQALAEDPNNALLNRLLIQNQQSKLRVLQRASTALQL